MEVNQLPQVGRIEGLELLHSGKADPSTHRIELQYTDPTKQWHKVEMPLLDALYLLNLLEAMSQDGGFDHLRRPPGTAQ